ncbi:MAG: hypothetical protein LBV34_07165, partial [Nocardiopsaceae bacterium]|nr:hypothetical protein [Nocardiopsaceae bacterium]
MVAELVPTTTAVDRITDGVALAYLLPHLRECGRIAAAEVPEQVDTRTAQTDAYRMRRAEGAASDAQRSAVRAARAALRELPVGSLPDATAERAVKAIGMVARLRVFADALSTLEVMQESERPHGDDLASWARSAASVRAAVDALEDWRPKLEPAVTALRERLHADEAAEKARLRDRLSEISAARAHRATELTNRLLAKMRPGEVASAPEPPSPERLLWLRKTVYRELYTAEYETRMAPWLGTDPFGLRELPPAP